MEGVILQFNKQEDAAALSKLFVGDEMAVLSWAGKQHVGRSLGFEILGWGRPGEKNLASGLTLGFPFQRKGGRVA